MLRAGGFEPVWEFAPSDSTSLRSDIEAFRSASLVVGVHGAGLANMVWCRPGKTVVVEICYNDARQAPCPQIYYHMAASLGLEYYVSVGHGNYASKNGVLANISDLALVIAEVVASRRGPGPGSPWNI